MSERLPIPPDLEHLIEKREKPDPRKEDVRRTGDDQRAADLGPLGALESVEGIDDVPTDNRRTGDDRREGEGCRTEARREGDATPSDNPPTGT